MQSFGHTIVTLPTIDSTNNYAMAQVHARLAKEGTIYFALEQSAGKGQRGKSWKTQPGSNIIMSLIIRPQGLGAAQSFLLNASMALGCYDFFESLAGPGTRIKWPNDIYWGDRKAGGILVENLFHGETWLYAVIGIGLNINQKKFDPDLPNPVSLCQITGQESDIMELIRNLAPMLQKRYSQLLDLGGDSVMTEYNLHLFKQNQRAKLKKGNMKFDAVIRHVSGDGKLVVERGVEQEFSLGEVEWLLDAG